MSFGGVVMDAGLTALAVAVVGVIGTLLSPVLAQRSTARANRVAAEVDRELRREERDAVARQVAFEERRTEYTALNALARTCRNQFKACARSAKSNALVPEQVTSAREAWIAYQDRYDSAQMILPDEILALASQLNRLLAAGYRQVQGLTSADGPDPETIVVFCNGTILDLVTQMRHLMRTDLGVSRSLVPSSQGPQA
ncbi:hypothetical protein [Micromonospora sp. DT231]|uniref:hypothetical protein n=1 Tax=Micromonospora sp. DT231 TaxID=3416526 RepID=UPI003CE7F414